jgi:hypothetical protein
MSAAKTVGQLFGSRRDLLRLGGLGLAAASVEGVWPLAAFAGKTKTHPRGNARNVVFYEINGAISHVDGFDFKENEATPQDLDVRRVGSDLYLSHLLFPNLARQMDKISVVRSMLSHEEVHFRGQYYVQTGRQLNLAFAREIPAVGCVIAAELEPLRRANDTFPAYMSFNLSTAQPGALGTGFLPPRFSVVDIKPQEVTAGNSLEEGALELLKERWRLLSRIRERERPRLVSYGREMAGYEHFYDAAYQLLTDQRWPAAFQISEKDRARYGDNAAGLSSILTRNILAQDAGTRYIHICHPGWDHHAKIWDRSAETNHYKLCGEFDPALASLLEDLAAIPSKNDPNKTLLDETLVVAMSEFGRTPGPLNTINGRDHYNKCFPALFAGAGVKGGTILGRTDEGGWKCLDAGWNRADQPRIENVVATMYGALGIDWGKEIRNTPSGRTYVYVDPLGPTGTIPTDEIATIYG